MKELIKWMKTIELRAHDTYLRAADVYQDDLELSKFLHNIAEEESWHYTALERGAELMLKKTKISSEVEIDEKTKKSITNIFDEIDKIISTSLPKDILIDKVVEAEISEWNDLFIYTIEKINSETEEFKYSTQKIQSHMQNIKKYLISINYKEETARKLNMLPLISKDNILIVDDEPQIRKLFKSLLKNYGNIDVAANGLEAMELVSDTYYNIIMSDIDMPKMDGISMYKEINSKSKEYQDKFIFMSGNFSSDKLDFLTKNNIKYLEKPVSISKLKTETAIILGKNL